MKSLSIFRHLGLSVIVLIMTNIFCFYISLHHIPDGTNKFFYALSGISSTLLGFLTILTLLNYILMPRDSFYSSWAWVNYLSCTILLFFTLTMPSAVISNLFIVFLSSVINVILFFSTMYYRTSNLTEIDKLRKLFPDEKSFRFDYDFNFRNDFGVDPEKNILYGIQLLTPFAKVVLTGDKFYFNDHSFDVEKLAADFKNAEIRFNTATPDEVKVVEMLAY